MQEISVESRFLRVSPQKVSLLANALRKKTVEEALHLLEFLPQKGAKFLRELLERALKIAKEKDLTADNLQFGELIVNPGPRFKRRRPGSRGRMVSYSHPTTHLKLVLREKETSLPEPSEKAKTIKPR